MNTIVKSGNALLVGVCLLACVGVVHARTIYVDDDGVADFSTIQGAVNVAKSGDTIVVQRGTYLGFNNRDISIEGKVLSIRSADPNDRATVAATIINCQGTQGMPHRAFWIHPNSGAQLTLAGLTIANGHAFSGGAVYVEGGSLKVTNCTFAANRVDWWGGAIYSLDSQVTIQGSTFASNASETMHGGALFCNRSLVRAANCTFKANTGIAIQNFDSSVTLGNCVLEDNVGRDGGAMHNYVTTGSNLPSSVTLSGCAFAGNVADARGGAVYNFGVDPNIHACTFTANNAGTDGGAIYNYRASPTCISSLFTGNAAVGMGGAVANWYESSPDLINCTFVANVASAGGAVASKRDSNPLISHSIVWNNTAAKGKGIYLARYEWGTLYIARTTIEYSDIRGGKNAVYVDPDCVLNWGLGNIDANPIFTGINNGDYHLAPDSPCVDAGDPDYLIDATKTDLDGNPRRFASAVDMGAYEFQDLGPVYRFWSDPKAKHFYTISGAERDKLVNNFPQDWTYEAIAYYAFYKQANKSLKPVYRFWSAELQAHFWTIREQEKAKVIKDFADIWKYEGVAFYAYPVGSQPLGTLPVHRFWSDQLGHHFYTLSEEEKDKLIKLYPTVWTYEGVAWYAYARPYTPKKAIYQFAGGEDEAWYTLSLKAYIDGEEAQIDYPNVEFVPALTQMKMTIDFDELTTTLDEFRIETEPLEHMATIRQPGPGGLEIPFVFSAEASFEASTPRGPFDINPETLEFADYDKLGLVLDAENETFSYNGSVTVDGQTIAFDQTENALQVELESPGVFESLASLPDGIDANMDAASQWVRQHVKDLLVETYAEGHLLQIYVVYTYVGTQGLWQGQILE